MNSKRLDLGVRRSQLPDEILQEIFMRLPLKPLVKLTAVCKSWNSLVKTSAFIHAHRARNNQDQNLLLTKVIVSPKIPGKDVSHDRHLFSLRTDEPTFPVYRSYYKQLTHPFESYNKLHARSAKDRLKITPYDEIQTCNGLVFLASHRVLNLSNSTALLWNPCIRKFVRLPRLIDKSRREVDRRISYGFGYDLRTDDYKVLRIVITQGNTSYDIWSLKRPCWRGLSVLPPVDDFDPTWRHAPIFVRGAVHWVHHQEKEGDGPIVSFDMSNEVFGEIMIPEVMRNKRTMVISRYGNCLATLQWDVYSEEGVDMWLMMEYGVVESWTKLVTVKSVPTSFKRLGCRNNGDVVIKIRRSDSFDHNTKKVTMRYKQKLLSPVSVDMVSFPVVGRFSEYLLVEPFEETLVLLDRQTRVKTFGGPL
ncbi:F-box/kelch-repeat protein At3g23880-like [Argentina anserina]|uniref:F-box/kelch-repeat protein At3g23880-like n=1 Tax=Argentina anserina TaxID=57926 RepID=UPI0021764E3B|nr:F-box/kelch-repeat protein At3g23880-like [Potentilla anserina]